LCETVVCMDRGVNKVIQRFAFYSYQMLETLKGVVPHFQFGFFSLNVITKLEGELFSRID